MLPTTKYQNVDILLQVLSLQSLKSFTHWLKYYPNQSLINGINPLFSEFYDLDEKYEEDFIDPSNAVSESSGHGNTRLRRRTSMEMSTKWEVQVLPYDVSRLRRYRL